jgi:hypothetical protein
MTSVAGLRAGGEIGLLKVNLNSAVGLTNQSESPVLDLTGYHLRS